MIAEGHGATLTDVDGNTFIDFTGGVGCLNVGHSHPRVVEAAQAQLEQFSHTDFTIVPYEVYVELAERLTALAPVRKPAKAAFFNAGTEAVENAVKFARAYTKRPAVIAFEGGFHGRTMLSLTMTSKTHPYKAGLGPFAPEVYRVPVRAGLPRAVHRRGAQRASSARSRPRSRRSRSPRWSSSPSRERPASFPRRGTSSSACGGSATSTASSSSPTRCRPASGAPGACSRIEHYGIEADLMTVAKSIAAGLPLSGVIGAAEIMDAPGDSAIGGTYVGNPVAQAAALAVLDVIEEEGIVERAEQLGEAMRRRMLAWQERFPAIGDVRGLGAMLAIELVEDRETKQPRAGPRERRGRRGCEPRPAAPEGGDLLELHPRPLAADAHRRGARRSAVGLGRGAGSGSRGLAAREPGNAFARGAS